MRCLTDFIGIEGCTPEAPESGLYVNRLPGVSIKAIDKLANSDQKSFLGVWRDVQERGLMTFTTQLTSYFRKKYKLKALKDRIRFGELFDTDEVEAAPIVEDFRGIIIELNPDNTTEPRLSDLISVGLTNFEFFSTVASDYDFVIGTLDNETELWRETITLTVGWNTIVPTFQTNVFEWPRKVFMAVVTDNAMSTIETSLSVDTGGGCGCECTCSLGDCCEARVRGAIAQRVGGVLEAEYSANAHGFRGFISLKCSYDGLVCANKDLFASALWYVMGMELMVERIHTARINQYTTVDLSKAKELKDEFDERWRLELDLVVDSIDLNDYGCCIQPNPVTSFQYSRL